MLETEMKTETTDLDKEWLQFISIEENTQLYTRPTQPIQKIESSIEEQIVKNKKVVLDKDLNLNKRENGEGNGGLEEETKETIENITISNCTKLAFLTCPIHLTDIFWKIQLINYSTPMVGIVQKQIRIDSKTLKQINDIQYKLANQPFYYTQHIIKHTEDPLLDRRKIAIGISKTDILKKKKKKMPKSFYNCFVLILRLNIDSVFTDFHIKIFNTGKIEIPGIINDALFSNVLTTLKSVLQEYFPFPLEYKKSIETVIINSNFNCGFCIHLNQLYYLLKNKYNLQTIYDPSSYPGIVCKYYLVENNKRYKNSFMIFRTGSILIVGRKESALYKSYEFLKQILVDEMLDIYQSVKPPQKVQKIKIYKRTILVTH